MSQFYAERSLILMAYAIGHSRNQRSGFFKLFPKYRI